jgi:hypothetical protein
LGNLSGNDANKVAIAAAGGVARVLAAMIAHAAVAGVHELACEALWNLSCCPSGKTAVLTGGGVDRIRTAQAAHPAHAGLQEQAELEPSECYAPEPVSSASLPFPEYSQFNTIHALGKSERKST